MKNSLTMAIVLTMLMATLAAAPSEVSQPTGGEALGDEDERMGAMLDQALEGSPSP